MVQMSDLFETLLSRITPTERELELARQHRDAVESRIKLEAVVDMINSGSYIKGTSIRPFTDLDLFVGFDATEYETDESKVITRLRYHLGQSFPESQVRVQTHSVGVIFSDGFRVDVVPGFALRSRPGYYRVRNRDDGRWVTTSIIRHKEWWRKRSGTGFLSAEIWPFTNSFRGRPVAASRDPSFSMTTTVRAAWNFRAILSWCSIQRTPGTMSLLLSTGRRSTNLLLLLIGLAPDPERPSP